MRSAAVSPLVIRDIFAENLEVQCVLEILAVEEPVNTAEECMIDVVRIVHTAIVLDMEAERGELAVLPEIQATRDLEISTAWSFVAIFFSCLVVVVNEEECVTPFVSIETLKGGGHLLTITTKVVKDLEVSLRFRHLRERHQCYNGSKKGFFRHKFVFMK